MKKANIITILILIGVVTLVGLITYLVTHKNAEEDTTSAAALALHSEDISPYTTLGGEPFDLTQFDGKVRVVNSWASWCPFCVKELRDFETLATEFKDR